MRTNLVRTARPDRAHSTGICRHPTGSKAKVPITRPPLAARHVGVSESGTRPATRYSKPQEVRLSDPCSLEHRFGGGPGSPDLHRFLRLKPRRSPKPVRLEVTDGETVWRARPGATHLLVTKVSTGRSTIRAHARPRARNGTWCCFEAHVGIPPSVGQWCVSGVSSPAAQGLRVQVEEKTNRSNDSANRT